jgi:hypothetical protein
MEQLIPWTERAVGKSLPGGTQKVSSIQQGVLMKMGSVDLIVCQGSSEQIP